MKNFAKASLGIAFSIITGTTVFSLNTLAGGWVSGGGEFITDQHNPWFLENTKTVKYCIDIDEKSFGLNRSDAETAVSDAINYWKSQLAKVESWTSIPDFSFRLGTQTYIKSTCDDTTDIRFQFGVFTKEQMDKLPNPKGHVGFTIRTDYDPVNMKGTGFIYISPESGPLALEINKGDNTKFWSDYLGAFRLHSILVHELGHTLGITHNNELNLMREDFPSAMIQVEAASIHYSLPENLLIPDFSRKGATLAMCLDGSSKTLAKQIGLTQQPLNKNIQLNTSNAYKRFFGITTNCYMEVHDGSNRIKIQEATRNTANKSSFSDIGYITVMTDNGQSQQLNPFELSSVFISEKSFLYEKNAKRINDQRNRVSTARLYSHKTYNASYTNIKTGESKNLKVTSSMRFWMSEYSGLVFDKVYLNLLAGY